MSTAAAAPPAAYKGIGVTVTDPKLGDQVTVEQLKVVQIPAALKAKYAAMQGSHWVLAKIKVKPGGKVTGGMTDTVRLFESPGDTVGDDANDATYLAPVVASLKGLGYPLIANLLSGSTGPAEGWVMFQVADSSAGPIRIVLHRMAMTLTNFAGSNAQLPEASFPVVN